MTTPVRTLTVLVSRAEEEAAAAKKEEEAAAKKKQEEAEVAAIIPTGDVSLEGSTMTVHSGGKMAVKLACIGTSACGGRLTLEGKSARKKRRRAKTEAIGASAFSIPAGKNVIVEFELNAAGRALLGADHGHASATLTVLKSSPAPSQTLVDKVQLAQQPVAKVKKPARLRLLVHLDQEALTAATRKASNERGIAN